MCVGGDDDRSLSSDAAEEDVDPFRNLSGDDEGDEDAVEGKDVVI